MAEYTKDETNAEGDQPEAATVDSAGDASTSSPPRDVAGDDEAVGEDESTGSGDDDDSEDEDEDEDEDEPNDSRPAAAATSHAAGGGGSKALIVGLAALLIGAGLGYQGHDIQRKQKVQKSPEACENLQTKLCSELGNEGASCKEAKAAVHFMTTAVCVASLEDLPATLEKAKKARAVCDDLVTRLCAEIGPGTETCKMITEQTQSFATSQCELMQEQFDQVLARVRMMAAQQGRTGGMPPGMSPHGAGPGGGPRAAGPGGPPGARPNGPGPGPGPGPSGPAGTPTSH